jgi:hypothetical protein
MVVEDHSFGNVAFQGNIVGTGVSDLYNIVTEILASLNPVAPAAPAPGCRWAS